MQVSETPRARRPLPATRLRAAMGLALALACADPQPPPPDWKALPTLPAPAAGVEAPRGPERPLRELSIALVGEVRGEIEPCGCPTLPYGGFARRERLLAQLHERGRPLLHLDAGDLLLKGRSSTRQTNQDDRAAVLLELSARVGVDAWTPGNSDLLALGIDGLKAARNGRLPAPPPISANLQDEHGALILPAWRLIERGGLRVAVLGVSPEVQGRELRDQLSTRPPAEALAATLATLPDDLDLRVAMGPLDDAESAALARDVAGLDLILSTRGAEVTPPYRAVAGGPLVVETPDRGRYLQLLDLRLGSDRSQPLLEQPEAALWRDLDTAREQLARAQASGSDRAASLESQLAALEARFADEGRGRNLLRVATLPLGTDLDPAAPTEARPVGPDTLAARIARFKESSVAAAAQGAAAAPAPGEARYVGSGECVNCHAQEFARWSYTEHAKAWMPLLKAGKTEDSECVACHSTAFGQPGGLGELSPANLRKWKAVQCEGCHGPMGGHPDQPTVHSRPITSESCVGCHDAANSPNFAFGPYLKQASCQATEAAPAPAP